MGLRNVLLFGILIFLCFEMRIEESDNGRILVFSSFCLYWKIGRKREFFWKEMFFKLKKKDGIEIEYVGGDVEKKWRF